MSDPTKLLKFWPSQEEFFNWGPSPLLFFGGVGSGKTFVLILKMLYLLDEYPGSRGIIVRQKFNQLKKTTAATLRGLLPRDRIYKRNENEGTITLVNGSEIIFQHLDKTDSLSALKSLDLNFAAVDQAEDISAEAWDTLLERIGRWNGATKRGGYPEDWPYRNRLGQCIPPRYLFADAYSPGYDHWLTARFWEHGSERARYAAEGYKVVFGSTRDNLALSEEYVQSRLARGKEYVRRYVDAVDWGAREGRIFDIDDSSFLKPPYSQILFRILHQMKLHRCADYGDTSPTVCLWYATDSDGNLFFYREFAVAGAVVSEQRKLIYEWSCEDGPGGKEPPYYNSNMMDPSIFRKDRGRTPNSAPTWSVADEWADRRIVDPKTSIAWRPAPNDEAMTVNRVREYLRVDPNHRHPITGKLGAPRVYFLMKTEDYPRGIHETIVDLRSQRRVEAGTGPNGEKLFGDERDEKVRDHWYDAFKYGVCSRPSLGPEASRPPADPGTIRIDEYFTQMDEEAAKQGATERSKWRGNLNNGY